MQGMQSANTNSDVNCTLSILDLCLHSSPQGSFSNDANTGKLQGYRGLKMVDLDIFKQIVQGEYEGISYFETYPMHPSSWDDLQKSLAHRCCLWGAALV